MSKKITKKENLNNIQYKEAIQKKMAKADDQLDIWLDRSTKAYALYANNASSDNPDIITDEEEYRQTLMPETILLNPIMKSASYKVKYFLLNGPGKVFLESKGLTNLIKYKTFGGVYRYVRESVQQEFGEEFAGTIEVGYNDEGRFEKYLFISSKPEIQQYARNVLENLIKDVTAITDFNTYRKNAIDAKNAIKLSKETA